jgi:uncharacterized membrane protein YfcA
LVSAAADGEADRVLRQAPLQIYFPQSGVQASIFAPYLCGIKGLLAAIMGVGGGFIMVPMMVYI